MKNRLWMVLSILLFSLTGVTGAAMALEPFGGHYYEVVEEALTWDEANAAIALDPVVSIFGEYHRGHLAVITSEGENAFVYSLLDGGALRGWIGGRQLSDQSEVDAGWQWATGEPMSSYINWDLTTDDSKYGSPNDAGGTSYYEDNGENCMEMRGWGYWDDLNCTTVTNPYVIEYEPIVYELITDGGDNPTDIGDLRISYIYGQFNVVYSLNVPWEIVETHVYIGDEAPKKSAPGRFPYSAGIIDEFIPAGNSVFIAAHAEVKMQTGLDEYQNPIYVYETVWAQVNDSSSDIPIGKGHNWATYFEYTLPVEY